MTDIWDEKPDLFVEIGELEDTVNIGDMTITTEEGDDFIKEFKKFDSWLDKLKEEYDELDGNAFVYFSILNEVKKWCDYHSVPITAGATRASLNKLFEIMEPFRDSSQEAKQ